MEPPSSYLAPWKFDRGARAPGNFGSVRALKMTKKHTIVENGKEKHCVLKRTNV